MVWMRSRLWGRQHGRRRRHPRPCPRTALNLGGTSRFASGTARHHAASPPADWQRQSAAPTRAPRTHGEGISTPSGGLLGHVTTRSSRETCPIPPERPAPATPGPLVRPPYPGRSPVSCMKVPTRRALLDHPGDLVRPRRDARCLLRRRSRRTVFPDRRLERLQVRQVRRVAIPQPLGLQRLAVRPLHAAADPQQPHRLAAANAHAVKPHALLQSVHVHSPPAHEITSSQRMSARV